MASKEPYAEDLPRKKPKTKEDKVDDSILDNIVNLADEVPRLFEVRSNIRRELSLDGSKPNLLDKSASVAIDKLCAAHEIERKGAIGEIMESAMKEFYSRILDKVNYLQVKQPQQFAVTSKPKELLRGENRSVLHNQRKTCENPGCVKEHEIVKLLGLGRWKLRSLNESI